MLCGQPPFVGQSQLDTYQRITRGKYKMPASFTPATKDFISRLLMHNPASRLGCSWSGSNEILTHTFYKEGGVDFKSLERREVKVPYTPIVKDPFDTSNFDEYDEEANESIYTGDQSLFSKFAS